MDKKSAKSKKTSDPTSTKEKSGKSMDVQKAEKEMGIKFPTRLKDFYSSGEYKQYEGLYAHSLPGYSIDSKYKVKFMIKDFTTLWEENGIEFKGDDGSYYIPFIKLGESELLGIDVAQKNCPIAMWGNEDGLFHLHAHSLDQFLSQLLKRGEKTPFEKIDKAIDTANALRDEKKYQQAIKILNQSVEGLIIQVPKEHHAKRLVGGFFNLRGSCNKNIGNIEQAMEDYKMSLSCGNQYGGLNLISTYLSAKDYPKALETITIAKPHTFGEPYFHLLNYKGQACIQMNLIEEAEKAYKSNFKEYSKSDAEKINICIEGLQKIVAEAKEPQTSIANSILKWFVRKN